MPTTQPLISFIDFNKPNFLYELFILLKQDKLEIKRINNLYVTYRYSMCQSTRQIKVFDYVLDFLLVLPNCVRLIGCFYSGSNPFRVSQVSFRNLCQIYKKNKSFFYVLDDLLVLSIAWALIPLGLARCPFTSPKPMAPFRGDQFKPRHRQLTYNTFSLYIGLCFLNFRKTFMVLWCHRFNFDFRYK